MEDRICRQETTIAFMERMVEQLNEALTRQQKEIDILRKTVDKLQAQMLNVQETITDKRPPHY